MAATRDTSRLPHTMSGRLPSTQNIRAEADAAALRVQAEASAVYAGNPALLRVRELEALSQLSANPAARIYIGFDKHLEQLDD